MDKYIKLETIGAFFLLFGFGSMLGIVGFVESLTVLGYREMLQIGTRVILSVFLMSIGLRIINGK